MADAVTQFSSWLLEFTVLANQLMSQHPERNPIHPTLLDQHVSGQVRPALVVLICAVRVMMLIVLSARIFRICKWHGMGTRQKEMALRAALGAGVFRLLRQVLTESVQERSVYVWRWEQVLGSCGAKSSQGRWD